MTSTARLDPSVGVLRDQREMLGLVRLDSVEEVEAAWERWAQTHGLGIRRRRGDHETDLRESGKVVVAYVSGGNQIADCPDCGGGVACWMENPRGCCLDCGTIYRVDHPEPADFAKAAELLGARVGWELRNWHRHKGETLDDLARENEMLAAQETILSGNVALADVEKILGPNAIVKLRKGGIG